MIHVNMIFSFRHVGANGNLYLLDMLLMWVGGNGGGLWLGKFAGCYRYLAGDAFF